MTTMSIEMLPAAQGDALWIEWQAEGRTFRMLIDGGPGKSYPALRGRVQRLLDGAGDSGHQPEIDLAVITHVDTDHIDGIVTLLLDDLELEFGDIWFNGRNHVQNPLSPVSGSHYLGGIQGQVLTAILDLPRFPWNEAFEGRAIVIDPPRRSFPTATIGGLTLTVLSPRVRQLELLADRWDDDVTTALRNMDILPEGSTPEGLAEQIRSGGLPLVRRLLASRYSKRVEPPPEWNQPSDDLNYLGDTSRPNGSSIALLVEDATRDLAVLFTGDAHASVLSDSVLELNILRGDRLLQLDALKLPHHGSINNISADLLGGLDCTRFLFSTDGSHGYDHPDDGTIELILREAAERGTHPHLHFNYLSDRTEQWAEAVGAGSRYTAHYPPQGRGDHGLTVTIGS